MLKDWADDAHPPIACADCKLGPYAVCGPSEQITPNEISTCRRAVISFPAGKTIFRENEKPSQCFTIYSGWAFCFKQLHDGRRQILSFLIPGDVIVLDSLCFGVCSLPFSVKSLTPTSACVFTATSLIELMNDSPELQHRLGAALQFRMLEMNRRLVDLGKRSALGRVGQLILELETRLRSRHLSANGRFNFPVRQEHIADAVGLTTVYVNRTLDRLRQYNVIEFDREHMTILDLGKLREIADEE